MNETIIKKLINIREKHLDSLINDWNSFETMQYLRGRINLIDYILKLHNDESGTGHQSPSE